MGQTQAVFICQNCGPTANADYNSSLFIKKFGIRALLDVTSAASGKVRKFQEGHYVSNKVETARINALSHVL
ncbi:MAG: hypothetical protein ACLPN1_06070 [Dissulfurispiraceae bacterium]